MNCLTRFFRPLVCLFALCIILSSCQDNSEELTVNPLSDTRIVWSDVPDLYDLLDMEEIEALQVIDPSELPTDALVMTYSSKADNENKDCAFLDYRQAIKQINTDFQVSANQLNKDIYVKVPSCMDGELVKTLVKVSAEHIMANETVSYRDCPFQDCEETAAQIEATFQVLANVLCKHIHVTVVCCSNGEMVTRKIEITSNCPRAEIVTMEVVEG